MSSTTEWVKKTFIVYRMLLDPQIKQQNADGSDPTFQSDLLLCKIKGPNDAA